MKTLETQTSAAVTDEDRLGLLQRIRSLNVNPFRHEVVDNPWISVIDAPNLYSDVKQNIRSLIDSCAALDSPSRCLTIVAPSGMGKTHLLSWTRQELERRSKPALFVFVPPYNADGPPFEQHLLRAVISSLLHRARDLRESFEAQVLRCLVKAYDELIVRGNRRHLQLGWFRSLTAILRPHHLLIGKRPESTQRERVRSALFRGQLLTDAFRLFAKNHPEDPSGMALDQDAFIAAAMLACGDGEDRWLAQRWWMCEELPLETLEKRQLTEPCAGEGKVSNALHTLRLLLNRNCCIAFDQFETVFAAYNQRGDIAAGLERVARALMPLRSTAGFCLLFAVQRSPWMTSNEFLPAYFRDRMVAGYGVQQLKPLKEGAKRDILAERLRLSIWRPLKRDPPDWNPFFPFSDEQLRLLMEQEKGDLRDFIQLARTEFDKALSGTVVTLQLPDIVLSSVSPRELRFYDETEIVIKGDNVPSEATIVVAGRAINPENVDCRPGSDGEPGEIHFLSPDFQWGEIEEGPVQVEVTSADGRKASVSMTIAARNIRPFSQTVCRKKLRQRREELKLAQTTVSKKLDMPNYWHGQVERGERDPEDDKFEQIAEVLGVNILDLLKRPSPR